MLCFDLVAMGPAPSEEMARRLGFKRIFSAGRDVEIVESLKRTEGKGKRIVRSDNFEVLAKSLRQNEFIGMLPASASVSKKALEILRNEGKLLFVPLYGVVGADEASRTQALLKARNLVRGALMARVSVCIVSMAEDAACLMSNMQMAEVAVFLGMDERRAKEAVGVLGGVL